MKREEAVFDKRREEIIDRETTDKKGDEIRQ